MTVTKSTLNNKLPTVEKISWCTEAGINMATKISCEGTNTIVRKWCFKQTSKSYPYQIQWRQRSRYTVENAKIKGANWTNWTDWMNLTDFTGCEAGTTEDEFPADEWLTANQGVNTKGDYKVICNFTTYAIPEKFDARQFQVRVRTFNKSQAKHGAWTSQTLTCYCRASVRQEKFITAVDGGVKVKFNYKYGRSFNVSVESVKDASGRELLKNKFDAPVKNITLTDSTFPALIEGHQGGKFEIGLSHLKRKINVGETLKPTMWFITQDGAKSWFACQIVYEPQRDIDVNVTYTWNEAEGILIVHAANEDEVVLQNIGASISYTYNGKDYSIEPYYKEIAFNDVSDFYFMPPIGLPLTIHVAEEDADDYKDVETVENVILSASGFRFTSLKDNSNAIAWGNAQYEVTSEQVFETALPHGRTRNVVYFGKGAETKISFSATIVDKEGMYGGEAARKRAWDKVRNNQGLYTFRTNKGDIYKVAITNVTLTHEWSDLYELQVDMTEVE